MSKALLARLLYPLNSLGILPQVFARFRARLLNPCSTGTVLSMYSYLLNAIVLEWTAKSFWSLSFGQSLNVILRVQETAPMVWFSWWLGTNTNDLLMYKYSTLSRLHYIISAYRYPRLLVRRVHGVRIMVIHNSHYGRTKYPPFSRWLLQIHMLEWQLFYFDYVFSEICSQGPT